MSLKLGLVNIFLMYALAAGVFFLIDLIWLGAVAKGMYDRLLGGFLSENVNWTAAIIFYAIYIGGILFFVLIPAIKGDEGIVRTAIVGGLLGFFAYSTFDLTCLALFRNWPVSVTIIDIIWGTFLTGFTAAATLRLARFFLPIG
jgi:uncharacterized membrane protein